ncbi:uncharacterized protein LOC109594591 [Aethina tumida]|uniref:uncharacterized protein LOC109594591 n=1 Tax=Aethina tumida TaxID=116153 RepID=UPI002147D285|nr:uncharacterized protein LOC109594591 [Aethina tumida]
MSELLEFDVGSELEDINYKCCFSRSVVLNARYKHKTQSKEPDESRSERETAKPAFVRPLKAGTYDVRKTSRSSLDDTRRLSLGSINGSIRSSSSSRSSDISVENIMLQSKVDTLQWQIKEIEKSREMYRAVMKQVVAFLEKSHHSLELLGNRINTKQSVPRSRSDHHMSLDLSKQEENSSDTLTCADKSMTYSEISWRRHKKPEVSPEEIPPEKLAQEAFRLLRTAQSLLNTREPDLAHVKNEPENNIDFLVSLAKEFPLANENRPQRTTSFSLCPKLILPDEVKTSIPLNRKLSLQLNETRRNSLSKTYRNVDSARGSFAENDDFVTSSINETSTATFTVQKPKYKESEKSTSPSAGSISSVEDESGFSSMNSFQDVGLPIMNSTMLDEVSTKNALLRSMLHNSNGLSSLEPTSLIETTLVPSTIEEKSDDRKANIDDIKLWQTPNSTASHKRWHSNPVDETNSNSMKVLWV